LIENKQLRDGDGGKKCLLIINITNIKLSFLNHVLVCSTNSQQYCCCVKCQY